MFPKYVSGGDFAIEKRAGGEVTMNLERLLVFFVISITIHADKKQHNF